ncbi:2-oxo acid dehydrogenase subunit E2 [Phreatobacter sp. AB_2022a]|uniref:2-oxo acid dehydrogenase subunit E2 n=1 Tax=Phreatobacter sp. AB_2022a TaxID=3003134 RepID=UPI002287233E|nr:2-oxo acid dehydrogenase subunit E2 [Phreatobacter sp. AB_2022a]MCZ0735621.1 2-oxo acid dehydrogenase subunit E2 [Phreatobacter sp. AB_2022a]
MTQASAAQRTGEAGGGRVFATPLARRLARDNGLDLACLRGSGPRGRIVERDIRGALAGRAIPSPRPPGAAEAGPAPAPLAATLGLSHFQIDCEIDALQALRAELNAARPAAARLSLADFLIRVAAVATRRVPAFAGEADAVDLALVLTGAAGEAMPVLRAADRKPLSIIHRETRALAERARSGTLAAADQAGGLLALANPGREGIRHAAMALPPARSVLCSFGAAERRPRLAGGAVVESETIGLTLSVDGGRINPAAAADWLKTFRSLIEAPLSVLV